MKKKILITLGFLFAASGTAFACPMCSDLLERGKDAVQAYWFAKGISSSIVLMMAMPYCLIGGMALMIYRASRKVKNGAGS